MYFQFQEDYPPPPLSAMINLEIFTIIRVGVQNEIGFYNLFYEEKQISSSLNFQKFNFLKFLICIERSRNSSNKRTPRSKPLAWNSTDGSSVVLLTFLYSFSFFTIPTGTCATCTSTHIAPIYSFHDTPSLPQLHKS